MEDLLTAHAARVAAANAELVERATALRDGSDARLRERLQAFGARLLDVAKELETEARAFTEGLSALTADIRKSAQAALDANVAEIALSAAAMQDEQARRAAFMATGVLPEPAAATTLAFHDADPAGGELVVLTPPSTEGDDKEASA